MKLVRVRTRPGAKYPPPICSLLGEEHNKYFFFFTDGLDLQRLTVTNGDSLSCILSTPTDSLTDLLFILKKNIKRKVH